MTTFHIGESETIDYTTSSPGEVLDGGRIEVCPACGHLGLAIRYPPIGRHYPARYIHRRPAGVAGDPRDRRPRTGGGNGQGDADSCFVDPAPRGDGLMHGEASATTAWIAVVRHHLVLLEAAMGLGWYDRPPRGYTAWDRMAELRPLLATNLPEMRAVLDRLAAQEDAPQPA